MGRKTWLWIACGWLAVAVGCGESSSSAQPFDPTSLQGKVDGTLSPELQAKQEAVRRLLNALQEGAGDTQTLQVMAPGINFQEKFPDFYEPGTKRLTRWEFGGAPNGREVPVVLYFDELDSGPIDPEKEKRIERVYVLSGSGNQFSIGRN